MIVVKITLNALADKHLEVTQTLLSMIEPVLGEQGCRNYHIFCDIRDKNRFCLLEEWETRESLNHHIKSCRFGVLMGIKTLLKDPLDIVIYTVSQLKGMEAVEALRSKGVSYDEDFAGVS